MITEHEQQSGDYTISKVIDQGYGRGPDAECRSFISVTDAAGREVARYSRRTHNWMRASVGAWIRRPDGTGYEITEGRIRDRFRAACRDTFGIEIGR